MLGFLLLSKTFKQKITANCEYINSEHISVITQLQVTSPLLIYFLWMNVHNSSVPLLFSFCLKKNKAFVSNNLEIQGNTG